MVGAVAWPDHSLLPPASCCLPPALACAAAAAAGAAAALLLGLNVARTYQDKLRQFLADVAGDAAPMGGALGGGSSGVYVGIGGGMLPPIDKRAAD